MSEIPGQYSHEPTSALVGAVFEEYHKHVHCFERNKLEKRDDIAEILKDFAGEYSNEVMYGIAQLVEIADIQSDPEQNWHAVDTGVYYALLLDSDPPNEQRSEYAISLFSDVRTTNEQMGQQIATVVNETEDEKTRIDLRRSLDPTSTEKIPTELWSLDNTAYPDLESLAEFAKNVNIEIVLIKACQALQRLRDERVFGAQRMRTILEVETTLAPMCEILGLDALAATLNSEVICSRLEMSGEKWAIDEASRQLSMLGNRETVENDILNLPRTMLGETIGEPICDQSKGYNTFFAHSYCEVNGLRNDRNEAMHTTVVSRIKTVGSLAANIFHNSKKGVNNYTAADTIGYTAIVDSDSESGAVFNKIVESFKSMNNCELTPSRSRLSPFHIKGSQEYILTVLEGIDDSIIDSVMKDDVRALFKDFAEMSSREDIKILQNRLHDITNGAPDIIVNQNGFNVTKVTAQITKDGGAIMPIEFQVVDKDARVNSRRGTASHIIHKLEKYGSSERNRKYLANKGKIAEDIAAIYERKSRMTDRVEPYKPNGQSFAKAQEMLEWYRTKEALRNGWPLGKYALGFCGI